MKFSILFLLFFFPWISLATPFAQHTKRPKLIVMIVVDQLRADTFTRLENKLLPAGNLNQPGGYKFLLSKGAYYPLAEYKLLAAMTCPGHAMISTGSYPSLIGIPLNQWYDSKTSQVVGCVEDSKLEVSPHNLKSSTLADELKVISPQSKVISIAIKDRSAVMLGGHKADHVYWFENSGWRTSRYYSEQLPDWVQSENTKIFESDLKNKSKQEVKDMQLLPAAVRWTSELARQALKTQKLGLDDSTDILAISYSSHDMAGHRFGTFSKEVEALTIAEDKEISELLKAIQKQMGSLNDVVIMLTGDHGIPPTVEEALESKLDSGRLDSLAFYKLITDRLNRKFGKPKGEWIKAGISFNYYINQEALISRKASIEQVAEEIKQEAMKMKGVYQAFTTQEFKNNLMIHPYYKTGIINQYVPGLSGDLVIIPQPFYMNTGSNIVNHLTGYSYDKFVPFVIMGSRIKTGVRSESMEIVDIAPTLSFLLGLVPPAKSVGRVLSESIK